jgi:hypothetical protein
MAVVSTTRVAYIVGLDCESRQIVVRGGGPILLEVDTGRGALGDHLLRRLRAEEME